MVPALTSHRTLGDIYGAGPVYSGYAPAESRRWIGPDEAPLLAATGGAATVLGDLPLLCATGALTDAGADLLREAGFDVPAQVLTFRDGAEYSGCLADIASAGGRLLVQHVHPAGLLPADRYWVPPDVLARLNDKGNLADLVPASSAPPRVVLDPADLIPYLRDGRREYPLVLKAATRRSTGSGAVDVFICADAGAADRAALALAGSERMVVEEWVRAVRFLCLNFAVDQDAAVDYLGSAEIVCDDDGAYRGNWLGEGARATDALVRVGREIAERGASLGYRGCLGVDVAAMADGTGLAVDLNFRLCGSTPSLLIAGARGERVTGRVARLRAWSFDGPFAELIRVAGRAAREGLLVPLSTFDPSVHGLADPARLTGLVPGDSRADVVRREAELAARGLR